ncbi:MAG: SGNH/GDSL hydrolase family protein [Anaerolineae bacterium]|nr:SGNH/GDSL hydrolase family protein [Anaerolineae bacterium]
MWLRAILGAILLVGVLLIGGEMWLRLWRQPALATPPAGLPPLTAALDWSSMKNEIRLVALGDSIVHGHIVPATAAWPARLEQRLREQHPDVPWRVIPSGICGETAVQGLARLERDALRFRPHALFIAFGLNDCYLARSAADVWREAETFPELYWGPLGASRLYRALRRHLLGAADPWDTHAGNALQPQVSPEAFAAALQRMVHTARRSGVPHITLLTMTPVGEWAHACWPPEVQTLQMAAYRQYNKLIRETAAALGVGLIDVEAGFAGSDLEGLLDDDGIHLTAAGQERLAAIVLAALEQDGTLALLKQP